MKFYKYHGLGNDYLVYDCNHETVELTTSMIRKICHRNYGVGADGILVGPFFGGRRSMSEEDDADAISREPDAAQSIFVRIYNPDGSEAESSGNGVRIFAKYLHDAGYVSQQEFTLDTLGGRETIRYNNENCTNVTVTVGQLDFSREAVGAVKVPEVMVNIPLVFGGETHYCTCVSIGNPHLVIVQPEVSREKVCRIGSYSETARYFPNRINTQIVKVIDRQNIQIEIYERGAGYTLASGTSACAAAGAIRRLGFVDDTVHVHMPGGALTIHVDDHDYVTMTGDVRSVGEITLSEEFERDL